MTATNLLVFAGVYFVAVATPGPGIALVVSRALGRGLTGLPSFLAGFVLGDIILMTVAVSGLAVVAQNFETTFRFVRVAGALYLVWMAYKIWRAPVGEVDVQPNLAREKPLNAFLSSLSLTLGNPKAITFFLSIMPLAVDLKAIDVWSYVGLVAAVLVVMTPTLVAWAVLASRARRIFRSTRAQRRLNRGSATVMVGAAVMLAAK